MEASEPTRKRMEETLPKYHEDHIAGKGDNSLQDYNLVHKFIPMPQAMKIPAAKAAVDKECENLEKILAWDLTKVRSKSEVIDEARTKGAKVHFASLMDICHLKNAELETKHQKYKGRVVLRGNTTRFDPRSVHQDWMIDVPMHICSDSSAARSVARRRGIGGRLRHLQTRGCSVEWPLVT